MLEKLTRSLSISPALGKPLPRYEVLADGLVITQTCAQAWVSITPASTQMSSEEDLDAQLATVISTAQQVFADRRCQIKIVWGRTSGEEYAREATAFTLDSAGAWAAVRAESIEDWSLPRRHVFIGIDIEDRTDPAVVRAINTASSWVRGDRRSIPRKELRWCDEAMRALAGRLENSMWRAVPTPVETLAWLIGRETYRTDHAIPVEGTVTGAGLAALTRGRVVPWRDHLRFYDETGGEAAYTAVLALVSMPEVIDTNTTAGQWLLTLSDIMRPAYVGASTDVAVLPEASIRFEMQSAPQALKTIGRVRKSANEQRREAAQIGAETMLAIEMTESEMIELESEIHRGRARLVTCWPVLTVSEADLTSLRESVDAVIAHYAARGIGVEVLADQQLEAWASTLPGDIVRVEDMRHVMDAEAFFGSWFWGGSTVGEEAGPVIGYTTGATKDPVRFRATDAPLRGDTATVVALGRSGRGKTTLLQLLSLDEAAGGAWVSIIDLKGDLHNEHGGIVRAAHGVGIHAERSDMTAEYAGVADLLAVMNAEDAIIHAHSQLMLLVSDALKVQAQPVLMEAISQIVATGGPRSTADLIDHMHKSSDPTARAVAAELANFAHDALGRLIVGRRTNATLTAEAGIHLVQFPKLDLPPAGVAPSDWTLMQRVSAAIARGVLAWISSIARDMTLRGLRKMIVVPEAHLFTATADGAAFLDQVARMGRAVGTTLVLDSQDPSSLSKRDGIIEQISTVFAFSQKTPDQQDSIARLLGLVPSDFTREQIGAISTDPATGSVWHGHCFMRDHRERVAALQVSIPNQQIAEMLSTTPPINVGERP